MSASNTAIDQQLASGAVPNYVSNVCPQGTKMWLLEDRLRRDTRVDTVEDAGDATHEEPLERRVGDDERDRRLLLEGVDEAEDEAAGGPARTEARRVGAIIAAPPARSGRTAKNTQCQLRVSVSQAEIGGPTKAGSTQAVEM